MLIHTTFAFKRQVRSLGRKDEKDGREVERMERAGFLYYFIMYRRTILSLALGIVSVGRSKDQSYRENLKENSSEGSAEICGWGEGDSHKVRA
jgi:hypothetical protein